MWGAALLQENEKKSLFQKQTRDVSARSPAPSTKAKEHKRNKKKKRAKESFATAPTPEEHIHLECLIPLTKATRIC